ncbi:glycosyltransferase 87 family protein [Spirilliplanes yamanashiensis]|uniref:Membrane protein n=1 Tax=Spirilliplanes yamanashiensis TaxID=42233 RepID=A0A8J3Y4X1_9ACTN|nr:glycosyltransferase 87 family protein [Spirilliplanes yamanashiensis]MDP9819628.1 alpha-1,2-mannosyltransferase [Spirilliplanes yamanashiensis]GIJ01552.1 membrane protein [Spirilliplanes yamanashiensis]
MSRRDRALLLAGATVAAAALTWFATIWHAFFDLSIYDGAVSYWLRDGGMIYDWLRLESRYGFTYPPFAAFLMAPMAYLPWPLVIVVACVATVVTTALIVWWVFGPAIRRHGRPPAFMAALTLLAVAVFEPMRETFVFGQVNTLLLAVVAADLLFLVARGSRWAGVGVGLAMAVKLTPGVFLLWLLVTRRWRAAAVATGTAAAATLLAAAAAPDMSREFWTSAIFDTNRVGTLAFVSNQSLQGVVARLSPAASPVWGLLLAAAALAVWAWRVRRADVPAGLALTGVLGCLVSPVTWVHHLVWLLPAFLLVVERGLGGERRLLWFAGVSWALMCSRVVWIWERNPAGPVGFLGSNLYVWISVALLFLVPPRRGAGLSDRAGTVRAWAYPRN